MPCASSLVRVWVPVGVCEAPTPHGAVCCRVRLSP